MNRTTLYVAVAIAAAAILGRCSAPDASRLAAELASQDAAAAQLRQAAHAAADSAHAISLRSDSLEMVAQASGRETVRTVTRWRATVDTLPVDTVAILAAFPALIAMGDSMAAACDRAQHDCATALAAKDAALSTADMALTLQRTRADSLDVYRAGLADRLRKAQRGHPWHDAGLVILGGLGGYGLRALLGGR